MVTMLFVLLLTGSPKELILFLSIIGFHSRIWHSYYIPRFIHYIDYPYKSFQIEEYNTQPSYSKNSAKF